MPLEEEKAEKFFREFWQRKPLLMRNAIPNFICPLDTDELAGLACEDEFNSRLMRVVKQQEKEKWTLEVGPFPEEVLQTLLYYKRVKLNTILIKYLVTIARI